MLITIILIIILVGGIYRMRKDKENKDALNNKNTDDNNNKNNKKDNNNVNSEEIKETNENSKKLKKKKTEKDKKLKIIVPIIVLGVIFMFIILASSGSSDVPSKDDIDNMSDKDMRDYILDVNDDKGTKLYNEDKDTYKYLFNKYFETNYDSVKLPTHKEIKQMTPQNDNLTLEQSIKLSLEDEKGYSMYLDNTVDLDKYKNNNDNDSNSDKESLEMDIESELSKAEIYEMNYFNDSLGQNAVITLEVEDGLTKSGTRRNMEKAVAETVKAIKDSDVPVKTFTIDTVSSDDVYDDNDDNIHRIKTDWEIDSVNNLSDSELNDLDSNLGIYAKTYQENFDVE